MDLVSPEASRGGEYHSYIYVCFDKQEKKIFSYNFSLSFRNSIVLTYVGLTLENSRLAGNKYLNFFIGGVLEVVLVVIIMFILHRYRCKGTC